MRALNRTTLISVIATAAVAILLCGCSSGRGSVRAQAVAAIGTTTSAPVSAAPTTTLPTNTTTPTVKGEIRGTATDFCSAISNMVTGLHKGGTVNDALQVLSYASADMRRFAPQNLIPQVERFTDGLIEVDKNIQLLVIGTNADFAAAMDKVLGSPDGVEISNYTKATCKK